MRATLRRGHRGAALITTLLVLVLVAAACTPSAGPGATGTPAATSSAAPTAPASVDPPTPSAAPTPAATGPTVPTQQPTQQPTQPATEPPTQPPLEHAWLTTELRDVRTGATIRPSDLLGKVIVIEPMAIWCSNCRAQQNEARTALANLGSSDIVYISLDVDPFESEADLALYADDRGYPWHFVVASDDLARKLANEFGDLVLSPSATPKIVIAPDGSADVSYGIKSAAQLEAQLAALLP